MRNLSVEWKWCYWLIWKVTLALWHGVVFQPCWMMAKILNLNIRDSESACCRGVLAVLVARCDAHAPQQRQEPGSHRPAQAGDNHQSTQPTLHTLHTRQSNNEIKHSKRNILTHCWSNALCLFSLFLTVLTLSPTVQCILVSYDGKIHIFVGLFEIL